LVTVQDHSQAPRGAAGEQHLIHQQFSMSKVKE
jgi:hypothetical protein